MATCRPHREGVRHGRHCASRSGEQGQRRPSAGRAIHQSRATGSGASTRRSLAPDDRCQAGGRGSPPRCAVLLTDRHTLKPATFVLSDRNRLISSDEISPAKRGATMRSATQACPTPRWSRLCARNQGQAGPWARADHRRCRAGAGRGRRSDLAASPLNFTTTVVAHA